jgi:hypothetical protein
MTGGIRACGIVPRVCPPAAALTQAGMIRPADARELITLLGTGDEGRKFRSAAELPRPGPDRDLGEKGPPGAAAGHPAGSGRQGAAGARRPRSPLAAGLRGSVRPRRRRLPADLARRASLAGAASVRRDRSRRAGHDLQHGGAGSGGPARGVGVGLGPGPLRRGLPHPAVPVRRSGPRRQRPGAHLRCLRGARRGDLGPRRGQRHVLRRPGRGGPDAPWGAAAV